VLAAAIASRSRVRRCRHAPAAATDGLHSNTAKLAATATEHKLLCTCLRYLLYCGMPLCCSTATYLQLIDSSPTCAYALTSLQEGWQVCGNCSSLVELEQGCNHMTCRCGYEFCYVCARHWKQCECALWDEGRLTHLAHHDVAQRQQLRLEVRPMFT
jgi:hypothetical protein